MTQESELAIWTVYNSPVDFPGMYVARKFLTEAGRSVPTKEIMVGGTLDQLQRELESRGLTMLPRDASDEPHIVEIWL